LHASFTVSDDTVRAAGQMCRDLGVGLHVHVAEAASDVDDAVARGYTGVIDRLARLEALVSGSIFAHGVHLAPNEVERVAAAGCWLVQNPRSNEGNRVGYPRALFQSPRVALGTDGYPADMAAEAEALQRLSKPRAADEPAEARAAAARPAASAALLGEIFGVDLGVLRLGAAADLVARDPTAAVRHCVVGGRVVVRDGALVGADIEAIRAEAREAAPRLWRAMEQY